MTCHSTLHIPTWIATALLLLASAAPASAHVLAGEATGFLSGLRHPFSGLDHVLTMVAVGLWGAQLEKPAIWLVPIAFPALIGLGGLMGLLGVPLLPGVQIGIGLSALVLGILALFKLWLPLWITGGHSVLHGAVAGAVSVCLWDTLA